jgi:hypothetical protein
LQTQRQTHDDDSEDRQPDARMHSVQRQIEWIARDEFLLAATAQNLRRLARLRPTEGLQAAIAA